MSSQGTIFQTVAFPLMAFVAQKPVTFSGSEMYERHRSICLSHYQSEAACGLWHRSQLPLRGVRCMQAISQFVYLIT
eukprot:1160409-Pelagomonas_calceolata.AAC.5